MNTKHYKKKILFVNGHMKYGGIENSLLNILRNIDFEKYEIDLLLIEGKGEYFDAIPSQVNIIFKDLSNSHGSLYLSVKKSILKKDILSFFARLVFLGKNLFGTYFLKLLRIPLLGKKKYDFAVAYRYGICTDIVQYSVKSKNKVTWWHHGEINLSTKQIKIYEKTCLEFKNLVVVSKASFKMILKAMPSVSNFVKIIPNMIDEEDIKQKSIKFLPNFSNEKLHFVTSSRIAPEKQIENVVYATELLLKKEFRNFQWHILGDGDGLENIINLSKQKKLSDYIIFHGKKENPFPYVLNSYLYIHTSYVESQGLSILEAMVLKTPCIITENQGIKEYANSINSVIVEHGAEHLANAIFDICNNVEKYNTLKENTKCPEEFRINNIVKKIDHLFS